MATARRRTVQEVSGLLEAILQDAERVLPQEPTTYGEWRDQLDGMDAWQAVVLSNVCDLLPGEVRDLVVRFQLMRDTVLYRDPSRFC